MSIISDALKKVEGNSRVPPLPDKPEAPKVEMMEPPAGRPSPPLFSVWSVVLSTIMVLVAAILLLATWYTGRTQRAASPDEPDPPPLLSPPVAATPLLPSPHDMTREAVAATREVHSEAPAPRVSAPATVPGIIAQEEGPLRPAAADAPSDPVPPEVAGVRPPAEPAAERAQQRDELVLTGVVYAPNVRMAHINGKILPEGAEINGYKIVTVARESVRLSKGDKFYILRLKR